RVITQNNPRIISTEHEINANEKVMVFINCNPEDAKTTLQIKDGWKISSNLYGDKTQNNDVIIKANDALVLMLKK
ncbi:MAG: hypothetical protein H7202_06020, partial [Pedobacter sp.]|nr:hypothetical protein [Pedobacter sp.]